MKCKLPGARAGRDTAAVRERRRLFGLRAGVLPRSLSLPAAVAPAEKESDGRCANESNGQNGPQNSNRGLTISSDASKDLTKDEELLLDRYRRFLRSERTKLRLTCLSPHGEMQEMEIALLPSSGLPKASGGIIIAR